MNFKKFNGTTWETVQHKIYGSGTDSLTAFPAVIQASGEPLTDYTIYGNTVQNGTPTPESPVDVVGCGIWDETQQSYKLPLTVNDTGYPIYLGQVETTRKIKKLVLTGEEHAFSFTDSMFETGTKVFVYDYSDLGMTDIISYNKQMADIMYPVFLCSHFIEKTEGYKDYNDIKNGEMGANSVGSYQNRFLIFATNQCTTAAGFKSYLAAQYAAGTPVTVWYVLETPETAIVNEPLHKIGDYADTISFAQAGVTIPTSDGDNTISFGTTVKPSAMSAAFKGWHAIPAPKVYDGNDWS